MFIIEDAELLLDNLIIEYYEAAYNDQEKILRALGADTTAVYSQKSETMQGLINMANAARSAISAKVDKVKKFFVDSDKKEFKVSVDIKKEHLTIEKTRQQTKSLYDLVSKTGMGKGSFVVSNILGWVPPFTPIPGASEAIYSVTQIVNFLLDIQRIWDDSSCSAVAEFVEHYRKSKENSLQNEVKLAKMESDVGKFIAGVKNYAFKVLDELLNSAQRAVAAGVTGVNKGIVNKADALDKKIEKIQKHPEKGNIAKDIANNHRTLVKRHGDMLDAIHDIDLEYRTKKDAVKGKHHYYKSIPKSKDDERRTYKKDDDGKWYAYDDEGNKVDGESIPEQSIPKNTKKITIPSKVQQIRNQIQANKERENQLKDKKKQVSERIWKMGMPR